MKWENYQTTIFIISFLGLNFIIFFGVENEQNGVPVPTRIYVSKRHEIKSLHNAGHVTLSENRNKSVFDFNLLIERPVCQSRVKLLIAIKSLPANIDRRNAIRETWGNLDNFNSKLLPKIS